MNEGEVMDLDVPEGDLTEFAAGGEDELVAQQVMEAMWGNLMPVEGGVALLAQDEDGGGEEEGAPAPNAWQMVVGGQVLAPGPTPFLGQAEGEVGPPERIAESEDEEGGDWEMEEVEDDDAVSEFEDLLESFLEAETDHGPGLASDDDDEPSNDSGSPDDHDMPTAAPAAERIAQTNGTAPPEASTAEDSSGGTEPRPSAPPPDVAGPSNPSPGEERGRDQAIEEQLRQFLAAEAAAEVAPGGSALLPGEGGEERGRVEGPVGEAGVDAALEEAAAAAFQRQLLAAHGAMFPAGPGAAARRAGGDGGQPDYAALQRVIEGALRDAEVQSGTGAGEGSAAAPARLSASEEGIPQFEQAEGSLQALSHALFGRPDDRSNEPGQTTDAGSGAAPEQELEWLRAAAGDDATVAGPSDDVMRGLYTKYVTYHRIAAEAQPAAEAEAEDGVGLHFRACGHAIHAKCLEGYFQSLYQSSMQRELFEGAHIVSLDAGEFLCPVCRRLANAALPMLPAAPSNALLTSAPSAVPASSPAGASAVGEVPPGAENGATSSPVATPGPSPGGASAAGEVPPRAQNGASSSTGPPAVSESPRDAPDTGPSSQAEARPGETGAGMPIAEYVRPAVKLILDAEVRTDPNGPYGIDESYWASGRNQAPVAPEVTGALENLATRGARLSGRTRPTHGLELWEALGFTVQATELAARRVSGSPERGAGILDKLGRSTSDVGAEGAVPDKGKRAVTDTGASVPKEESSQVERAQSDVTDHVSKRLEALAAAAGDEGRSVLRPLAQATIALRGASIPEQLFRARGLQILAGALLRGKSRDELPSELTAGHSDRTAAETRFWRLLADPVLFHDPFSTLVRLLYVLKGDLLDAEGMKALIRFLHLVLLEACNSCPHAPSNQEASVPPTEATRAERLRRMSLPFLRQSALLLEALHPGSVPSFRSPAESAAAAAARSAASRTRIVAPPEEAADVIEAGAGHLEALVLEADLGLALERITAAERADVAAPADTWQRHFEAEVEGWRGVETYRGERDARPFQLMQLPRNYHELFQRYVKAKCRLCKTVPVQPVLCLVCGAFLCGHSRKACCRVDNRGECYRHASECGVGVGVFLFLRRTTITLLRNGRQTVWLSPYLDAHGEEDIDLRRGKPLFLSEERYNALTEMVASMGMDHDSQVLARTVRRLPQAIE
ncbi:hypothetical protein KFL_003380050 [Klebsormidium nitens]|uniref:E3 ubiquitin-protein ligase n=1 Tax=Klebsormidium nitens TaxID=105231 RepID=A0A1Y1I8D2_KLENI|nr:hypothetical protein KFL_003380050 [Klebsormidium nitens]|eukprot:GAQ87200.1 hypothetical protein KFL_003380050 [Klebsormidium nitens]